MAVWNPALYTSGANGRSRLRAALDLLTRTNIAAEESRLRVRSVLDLGCGPGNVTPFLKNAFPNAKIHGVDSSKDMIDAATKSVCGHPAETDISFSVCSVEEACDREEQYDVVYSNAVIHWVPNHDKLIPKLVNNLLNPNGIFSFQMPDTRLQKSHLLMEAALDDINSALYAELFTGTSGAVGESSSRKVRIPRCEKDPDYYLDIIEGLNTQTRTFDVDHWSTVYNYHLPVSPIARNDSQCKNEIQLKSAEIVSNLEFPVEHPVCSFVKASGLMSLLDALRDHSDTTLLPRYMERYNRLLYEEYPVKLDRAQTFMHCDQAGDHEVIDVAKLRYYVLLGYKRYFCVIQSHDK